MEHNTPGQITLTILQWIGNVLEDKMSLKNPSLPNTHRQSIDFHDVHQVLDGLEISVLSGSSQAGSQIKNHKTAYDCT